MCHLVSHSPEKGLCRRITAFLERLGGVFTQVDFLGQDRCDDLDVLIRLCLADLGDGANAMLGEVRLQGFQKILAQFGAGTLGSSSRVAGLARLKQMWFLLVGCKIRGAAGAHGAVPSRALQQPGGCGKNRRVHFFQSAHHPLHMPAIGSRATHNLHDGAAGVLF
jgi:hypothetical protein